MPESTPHTFLLLLSQLMWQFNSKCCCCCCCFWYLFLACLPACQPVWSPLSETVFFWFANKILSIECEWFDVPPFLKSYWSTTVELHLFPFTHNSDKWWTNLHSARVSFAQIMLRHNATAALLRAQHLIIKKPSSSQVFFS